MIVTVLSGAVQPYQLRAIEGYQPRIADLGAAATSKTKAMILNSPSNPLGSVASADRIRDVLAWAAERGIWVVYDECYDEVVFDDSFVSLGALAPAGHLVSCYSFSKTYAMTFMAPTTHAQARLLLLVRGRGANVLDLRWRVTLARTSVPVDRPHDVAGV